MRQRSLRVRVHGMRVARTFGVGLMALVMVACWDSHSSGNDVATVTPMIAVRVAPSAATLAGGGTLLFVATVTNASSPSVSWQVSGIPGGNSQLGTISANGMYASPTALPSSAIVVMVTAVADADPSKSATAPVIVTAPATAISPSGSGASSSVATVSAPSVPTGLATTGIATGSIGLSWSAASDSGGTGVGGYYVYRNGARVGTITGTSFTDRNLTASTSYSYQVAAFDNASPPNVSTLSAALSVTTLPDTQPPTVPTGLSATNVGLSSATLSWNASTDQPNPGATGVGGYIVYRGGVSIGTTTTTSYTDNSLTSGASYSYQVAAFDKATPTPNTSSMSAAYALTTKSNVTVTPANAALTLSQRQQFTTNAAGGTTLNWYVDGVQGGSSALGTISSTGLYTPPAMPGIHTVRAASSSNPSVGATAAVAVTNLSGVTTYQYDQARTGQNLQEYALTPATVSSGSFGKRWSCPLDGIVYAQPLYMANLQIGGTTHNVLFVATMHDSVYAFDADSGSCQPLWKISFINPSAGITSTPSDCGDTPTEYGITGTPVIDPVSQTLYLVASTNESTGTVQRLHALNILNGADRVTPTAIQAQIPGTGDNNTTVVFNALVANQRPGLVLTNGNIYIGWASHCDTLAVPWHGWLMSYNAGSLSQSNILNVTPNGNWGGIWMSGAAPAVDSSGNNMYLSTGNGAFDNTSATLPALSPNNDFGESFLNVDPSSLQVRDFYTPSQYAAWANADLDISSGAVTILPDGAGPAGHPNVLIGTDKQGHLWMIDRNNMSGYVPGLDNTVQNLTLPSASIYAVHSAFGYWNGTLYISVGAGPLMAFHLINGLVPSSSGNVAVAASQSAQTYNFPNPTPSISASPNGDAIVWVLDNNANGTGSSSGQLGPAVLRAYDATNLGSLLYSSSALATDAAGNASKFIAPVVANGHVYVVGHDALTVYGLTP